jgi:hypothetical protein
LKIAHSLLIQNRGQELLTTNFWDTPMAEAGFFYLSWNAGAGRLLVPDAQRGTIEDMKTAQYVVVSRGFWKDAGRPNSLELMFEDFSDTPFSLCLSEGQMDRLLPKADEGGGFDLVAWTRKGEALRLPGKYRLVERLPCLAPWRE